MVKIEHGLFRSGIRVVLGTVKQIIFYEQVVPKALRDSTDPPELILESAIVFGGLQTS